MRIFILNIKKTFTILAVAITLLCGHQAKAAQNSVQEVKAAIVTQAMELGIDPALALSIAKVESGFRMEARSAHGAVGVFQIMPSTAKKIGVNPYTMAGNIKGGLKYYLMMYRMFGSVELALAAYNAGPGNVKKYNSVPPFGETQRFVKKIMDQKSIHNNDPLVLQAKAPKPVAPKNSVVPAEVISKEAPVPNEEPNAFESENKFVVPEGMSSEATAI